jgi:hypothetical protein
MPYTEDLNRVYTDVSKNKKTINMKNIKTFLILTFAFISTINAQDALLPIPYLNIDGKSDNYSPKFMNGDIESPPVDYYRINIVKFELGREKRWWKKYAPVLNVTITDGNLTFNKIINSINKSSNTNGRVIKSKTIINKNVANWIPYKGNDLVLSISLYPIQSKDNIKETINSLVTVGNAIGANNENLINSINIVSSIATSINNQLNELIIKSGTKDEINYEVALEHQLTSDNENLKLREGFFLLSAGESQLKPSEVKIDNFGNVTVNGKLNSDYSYIIIKISKTTNPKGIQKYDFYVNLLEADNALSNGDIEEMDRKLIEFKSLFFNSTNFTLNMKKDIWKEKYLLYAKRAKKIDDKYELKQYFFDKNDNIITLIESAKTKGNNSIIAEIDKQAIKAVLQNYFKYEKEIINVPDNIDELQKLYLESVDKDKQEINKMLDNDFQIKIENNDIQKYIDKSNSVIQLPFNQDKVQFNNLLKKYDIKLNSSELQKINTKIE